MSRAKFLTMHQSRLLLAMPAIALASLCVLAFACSGDDRPPPLTDSEGGTDIDAGSATPCDPPTEGCPCSDAGSQLYCGTVYRVSGTHVDCSKGYRTCSDQGSWGPCEGPKIYGAE